MAGTPIQETADDEQDPTAPGSPAWWAARQGRAEPPRRIPITLDRIVAGALELIDREGLGALSMRNLASELQTGTTTLYRYVAGKDEVLVLVADAVLRESGFDETLAANVYTAVAHQVLASVLQEPMNDFRAGGLGASKSVTLRDFYRSLPAGQYPHLVELADELTSRTATEEFEFGLACLLDGVELRLQQAR